VFFLDCRPMRRPSTLISLVLLVFALAAVPAGAAKRAQSQPLEIGLQDDQVFVAQNLLTPQMGYDLAKQLDVSRLRVNLGWAGVVGDTANDRSVPRPVPYDWSNVDRAIDQAAANGQRVQLTLLGPVPAWASARHGKPSNYKPNPLLFAQFARAAAKHFKGRVDRYSIWNEPNYSSWLNPHVSAPQQYRALYIGAYKGIKRVDPNAQVLLGETSPIGRSGVASSPLTFLRQITCSKPDYSAARRCPPLRTDGYAHHPYTLLSGTAYGPYFPGLTSDDVTTGSLVRLDQALDKLQKRRALINTGGGTSPTRSPLNLYLTEYGFYARGKTTASTLPETQRAAYLRKGFQLALKDPRVKLVVQYLLAPQSPLYSFDTSLVDKQGQPDLAFQSLAAWVQQAGAAGQIVVPTPFTLPPAPVTP
jgi:polysaccharide biosynthesis protein PslG